MINKYKIKYPSIEHLISKYAGISHFYFFYDLQSSAMFDNSNIYRVF